MPFLVDFYENSKWGDNKSKTMMLPLQLMKKRFSLQVVWFD